MIALLSPEATAVLVGATITVALLLALWLLVAPALRARRGQDLDEHVLAFLASSPDVPAMILFLSLQARGVDVAMVDLLASLERLEEAGQIAVRTFTSGRASLRVYRKAGAL